MLRRVLSMTILIVFLAWVGWYVHGNLGAFAPILDVTWLDCLKLTLAFLLIMTGNGLFVAVVSSALGIRLVCGEYMSLSFASSFANYFLPLRGGTGIRALYMNHVHGFPIIDLVSILSIMYVMHSIVNGLLALVAMGLIAVKGGPVNSSLVAFFALIVAAGVSAMFVNIKIDGNHGRFPLKQIAQFSRAWRAVRGNRLLLTRLWMLILVMTFATVWQCRAAFDAVAVPLPLEGVFIYAASKNLAALIGLTPGALGIVELVSIYLGNVLGYTTVDALSVQGLIRAVAIIVLLVTGPFAFMFLKLRLANRDANEHKVNS
jgi:uncharacterized membrane protein YbhN (UPF0104 family)